MDRKHRPAERAGKAQHARQDGTNVGHEASRAGSQVGQQAAGHGKQVAAETGRQARDLVGPASEQMRLHAQARQKRAADGLRALGTQLQSMASKSEQDGAAKEVVRHGRFVHGPAWFDSSASDTTASAIARLANGRGILAAV